MHKLLGLSCLVHFFYRFAQFLHGAVDMGFDASTDGATLGCLLVHTALSCSSLIFQLPTKRIKEGSRIWPEYRLHSIVFACRSLACMVLTVGERMAAADSPCYALNALIVLGACAAADAASQSVDAAARSSTIRELAAPPPLKFFFSVSAAASVNQTDWQMTLQSSTRRNWLIRVAIAAAFIAYTFATFALCMACDVTAGDAVPRHDRLPRGAALPRNAIRLPIHHTAHGVCHDTAA